jgi:hypothetical protein
MVESRSEGTAASAALRGGVDLDGVSFHPRSRRRAIRNSGVREPLSPLPVEVTGSPYFRLTIGHDHVD